MSDSPVPADARFAVSGATGLIGAAVARGLAKMGDIVTIGRSDRNMLRADFSDPASVRDIDLDGVTALVHCAGVVDEDFSDTERAFRQATLGMAALVARAKACGVSRFVCISSAHVYGPMSGTISEENPPNPLSDYAIAHFASEQVLRRAVGSSFYGAVLRPNAVFGIPPDLARFRRWGLIPFGFPKSLVETGRIVLQSTGAPRRNFVGVDDIAASVASWLKSTANEQCAFTLINPVGRESMSVWEFAGLCAKTYEALSGKKATLSRPEPPAASDTFDYVTREPRYVGKADIAATIGTLMGLLNGRNTASGTGD